jgi:hypothetical protein
LAPFLAAFPFTEESTMAEFQQQQSEHLLEYPVLAFYRFASNVSNLQSLEEELSGYLEAGGTVVTDLSGMEDLFGRTLDFLNVHVFRLSFQDRIPIQWADAPDTLPGELDFSAFSEQGWSGATYEGLDSVLASVERDGSSFPVFGYKQVGRGRVWFIGANLLYYAQLSGNQALREYIRETVLGDNRSVTELAGAGLAYPALPIRDYAETSQGVSFQYETTEPVEALVSYTYSPRWSALVDGIPVTMRNREGLIRLTLPAGRHFVEVRNQPFGTVWPVAGWTAGILGVLLGGAAILLERKRKRVDTPKPNLVELFQKPEGAAGGGTYVSCAHCGFRLAESQPPTPVTYPFSVSRCPICDAHMDDEGYVPGRDLSREEQARALNDWLRANGYDPRSVYTEWGFSVEEFFQSS